MYPFEKYQYYVSDNKTVYAVSTYAGKTVRGKATCHMEDKFSLEKGKTIAALRCNVKVAQKRKKRAEEQLIKIFEEIKKINQHCEEIQRYYDDATLSLLEAKSDLANFMLLEVNDGKHFSNM